MVAEPAGTSETETPEIEAGQAEAEANAMLRQNTMALELQLEERPLARRQTELLRTSEEPAPADSNPQQAETGQKDIKVPDTLEEQRHEEQKHERKALLKNDDHELERVSRVRNRPIVCMPYLTLDESY